MSARRLPEHVRRLVEAQTTGRQEQRRQNAPQDAPGRPKQSERDWQATVLKYAALRGWRAYHNPDSRRSTAGFPDLVLVRRPHVVFAELKTDGGRVRPEQHQWLDELRACGVTAVIWRPQDWDTVREMLT